MIDVWETFGSFTFSIKSQLDFIQSKKLGYDTNSIIKIPISKGGFAYKYKIFKNELLKIMFEYISCAS